jgi:Cys-tRNA(Pro)/Cys-tRNA(Cys) deacylase
VKTNAARALDRLGVAYEWLEYPADAAHEAAPAVAAKLGLAPSQVFKTLVVRGDRNGVVFAVLPGDRQLDLRALARVRGDRSASTVALAEVQPLTGYVRGGVTALAARRAWPVVLDASALDLQRISVSAGQRGAQLLLAPADFVRATGAVTAPIAEGPR